MKKKYWNTAILTAVFVLAAATSSPAEETPRGQDSAQDQDSAQGRDTAFTQTASSPGTVVEYANLRLLLKEGNLTLKKTIENQEDTIDAYQEMWDIMKWEQGNLEDKAEDMTGNSSGTAAVYSSNAAMLNSSASRIYRQLESLTDEKSMKSTEKSADSYTYTAQTLMNSYNQMAQKVESTQKSVNALEASFRAMEQKGAAGSATQPQIQSEKNRLEQARISLASLKEQALDLRFQLLTMLGMGTGEAVSIGAIPQPDLEAIAAIDFESDKQKAIGNDSKVQSERHAKAYSTADINRRFKQVAEAEGTAEASIQSAYDRLQASRTSYQSALDSYSGALLTYQSLQQKKAAGMLSNTEYLQGEAGYAEKKAAKEAASMDLVQAYETYCWEVRGISG